LSILKISLPTTNFISLQKKSEPMSEFIIRCPSCSKGLKLKDQSRIGKKAKCPKCETIFVMQLDQIAQPSQPKPKGKKKRPKPEPAAQPAAAQVATDDGDEVEFQLAAAAPAPPAEQQQPLQGTSARWIPDDAPPSPAAPAQQPAGVFDPTAPVQPTVGVGVAPVESGVARLGEIRRRAKKRNLIGIIVGVITASLFYGAYVWAEHRKTQDKLAQAAADDKSPKRDMDVVAQKDQLLANSSLAEASSPTEGEKINLACIPMGAQALISIRPAELLAEGPQQQEFWFCLGPFGDWLAGANNEDGEWVPGVIEQLCHRKPADIEHVLIAVMPQEVGEPAQYAAVVTLKEPAKKSELLKQYGGDRNDSYGYPVYIDEATAQAYLIKDLKTIAIAPASMAEEMADSVDTPNSQSDGLEALMQNTDVDRHCTIMFNPRQMLRHEEVLFAPDVFPLIHNVMGFFNDDDIETVSWAVHLGDDRFHSEILMRNRTQMPEHQLEADVRKKLNDLPNRVWHELVEKMNPPQLGYRRVISRFPAMVKLFSRSTMGGMGTRYAQLITELPERAAPNLALATLLAWDESTRTDFTKAVIQKPKDTGPKLPQLAEDRLKMKIEVEFKRQPLQEAIAFIAEECKVGQSIDGDALKDKGYTKNMAQTFDMKDTGFAALKKIMDQYDDMCIVLDEKTKSILLTTRKFAAQNGQTVYEIK
jgi:hypothetical protein